jgi:hypothetical protein
MTTEKQLLDALHRLASERHVELDLGFDAELVVPILPNGAILESALRVSMFALTTVPGGEAPPESSSDLVDPVWPHPAAWNKPDD